MNSYDDFERKAQDIEKKLALYWEDPEHNKHLVKEARQDLNELERRYGIIT
jgi:hypothetical protein